VRTFLKNESVICIKQVSSTFWKLGKRLFFNSIKISASWIFGGYIYKLKDVILFFLKMRIKVYWKIETSIRI